MPFGCRRAMPKRGEGRTGGAPDGFCVGGVSMEVYDRSLKVLARRFARGAGDDRPLRMSEFPARKRSQVLGIGQAALHKKRLPESHSGLQERSETRPKGCGGLLSAGPGLCRNR